MKFYPFTRRTRPPTSQPRNQGRGGNCLLATGGLNPEQVSLFVDSNPNYQRQQLRGVPVVSPAEMRSRDSILISSRGFQREIQNQIQHQMGLENRLILLYK
jgi:hypothetical protein